MGASLSYETTTAPSGGVVDLIVKEARALARIADHWCEPYVFHQRGTGALAGSTKVSLPCYTAPGGRLIVVEPGDDMFMMAQEVDLLLRGIAAWARGYKLEWSIQFEGAHVGNVGSSGAYSASLQAFLSELHLAAQTPTDPEEVKLKVSQLKSRYASRNDA